MMDPQQQGQQQPNAGQAANPQQPQNINNQPANPQPQQQAQQQVPSQMAKPTDQNNHTQSIPTQSPASNSTNPQAGMPPQDPSSSAGQADSVQEEDKTPANFQLGTLLPAELKVQIPENNLNFDEQYFLRLLAGSISLSKDEKKRIIESIPKLKQEQIDELIKIFEEEKFKFSQLSKKHVPQLEKLAKQHYQDWIDLETEVVQTEKKREDEDKADEIRKSLGL
ncbi:hypothetical protein GF376_02305 [Candidatus Peregrinibacteria bacterium]|nr:hypothetical protein [Candidatus Peregrinibacteria bacterium]